HRTRCTTPAVVVPLNGENPSESRFTPKKFPSGPGEEYAIGNLSQNQDGSGKFGGTLAYVRDGNDNHDRHPPD
ncbi:hypothetical protein, partial [Actinotignum timonense]|uniref:hypothetical protein n=2 Tax=Actinotignum timonense TaxID=1870995 RepID=UPI00254D4619